MVKFSYSSSLIALSLVLGLGSFDLHAGKKKREDSSNQASSSTTAAKQNPQSQSEFQFPQVIKPVQRDWLPDDQVKIDPTLPKFFKVARNNFLQQRPDNEEILDAISMCKFSIDEALGKAVKAHTSHASSSMTIDMTKGLSQRLYNYLLEFLNMAEYAKSHLNINVTPTLNKFFTSTNTLTIFRGFEEFNLYKPQMLSLLVNCVYSNAQIELVQKVGILSLTQKLIDDLSETPFEREIYDKASGLYQYYLDTSAEAAHGQQINGEYFQRFVFSTAQKFIPIFIRSENLGALEKIKRILFPNQVEFLDRLLEIQRTAKNPEVDTQATIAALDNLPYEVLNQSKAQPGQVLTDIRIGDLVDLQVQAAATIVLKTEPQRIKKLLEESKADDQAKKKKKKKNKREDQDDGRRWVPDEDVKIPGHIEIASKVIEDIIAKKHLSENDLTQLSKLLGTINTKFHEVLHGAPERADAAEKSSAPLPANGMSKALFKALTKYLDLIERVGKKYPRYRESTLKEFLSTTSLSFVMHGFSEFNPYKSILINCFVTSLESQCHELSDINCVSMELSHLYEDLIGTEFERDLKTSDHFKVWTQKTSNSEFWANPTIASPIIRHFIFSVMPILINQKKMNEVNKLISCLKDGDQNTLRKIIKLYRQRNEKLGLDQARLGKLTADLDELISELNTIRAQHTDSNTNLTIPKEEFQKFFTALILEDFILEFGTKTVLDLQEKMKTTQSELLKRLAESERKLAESERKLAESQRKLAESERGQAASAASAAPDTNGAAVATMSALEATSDDWRPKHSSYIEYLQSLNLTPAQMAAALAAAPAEPIKETPMEIVSASTPPSLDHEDTSSQGSHDSDASQGSSASRSKPKLERTESWRQRKQERDVHRALVRQDSMKLIAAEATAGSQNPHLAYLQSLGNAGKAAALAAKGIARLGAFIDAVKDRTGRSSMQSGLNMQTEEFQIQHANTYQTSVNSLDPSLRTKFISKIEGWMKELKHSPMEGRGKPEYLSQFACYSRRLDKQYRLLYKVEGDIVTLIRISDHYGQK